MDWVFKGGFIEGHTSVFVEGWFGIKRFQMAIAAGEKDPDNGLHTGMLGCEWSCVCGATLSEHRAKNKASKAESMVSQETASRICWRAWGPRLMGMMGHGVWALTNGDKIIVIEECSKEADVAACRKIFWWRR